MTQPCALVLEAGNTTPLAIPILTWRDSAALEVLPLGSLQSRLCV